MVIQIICEECGRSLECALVGDNIEVYVCPECRSNAVEEAVDQERERLKIKT